MVQHLSAHETTIYIDPLRSPSTLNALQSLYLSSGPHLTHLEPLTRAADMALFFTLLNSVEPLTELDLTHSHLARIKLHITTRWRMHENLGELVQPLLDMHFRTLANITIRAPRRGYPLTASDLARVASAHAHLPGLEHARLDGLMTAAPHVAALTYFVWYLPRDMMPKVARMHLFMLWTCSVGDARSVRRYMFLLLWRLLMPHQDLQLSGWDEVLPWVAKYQAG
ncbi:hypothetical protein V8D89_001316 [Ganoderma adspersum]